VPPGIEHFGQDTVRGKLIADACVHALLVLLLIAGFWYVELVGGGDLLRLDAQHLVLVGGETMADGQV
jgi:hypothetical protein